MGEISVKGQDLNRLLADSTKRYGTPYHQAFAELAATHRGRPPAEIVPLLRAAADQALLGFTGADLREQAEAISTGRPYTLRVTVT
ncbi:hypothetical protein J7E93_06510 [Streptomyces sp. ISL-36]|uniref:hypothetical protein n=1 Tax=Streptomyces sp. ISL-36 TaxID=2819182 RepID=UPI001BE83A9A|nr:hypothetical protein [Streptomyces sp. ISL-36]MBT2439778.1 hypothetical protein [Streptomyces sp. ISL-36]